MLKNVMCILMLVMFMCVGCKQATFTEVKLLDLDNFEASEEMKALPFMATIAFEIPSEKEYNKSNHFLQETLTKYFINPTNMRYTEKNFLSMVYVDVDIPVMKKPLDAEFTPYYFIYKNSTLSIKLSESALALLNADIKSAFGKGLNPIKDIEFIFKIVNNDQVGYKFNVPYPVFYNGRASIGGNFELAPGESSLIQLSNVLTDLSTEKPIEVLKM